MRAAESGRLRSQSAREEGSGEEGRKLLSSGERPMRRSVSFAGHESRDDRRRPRAVSALAPLPTSCYTVDTFLFFLVSFQLLNLLTLSYTNSVLGDIENRFRVTNTLASLVPSSYQIGKLACTLPVSYFGSRANRPRVIAVGVGVMVAGLGFCFLPHAIMAAPPRTGNATDSWLCEASRGGDSAAKAECLAAATFNHNPALLLIIGHVLVGCGSTAFWSLGVSYIDDHVVIRKIPIYIAIFAGSSLAGPVLGYGLGGVTSLIYVDVNVGGIRPGSPFWIGAWWLGYVVAGIALLILLFPFNFYPKSLPISAQKREEIGETDALIQQRHFYRSLSRSVRNETGGCGGSVESSEVVSSAGGNWDDQAPSEDTATHIISATFSDLGRSMKRIFAMPLTITAFSSFAVLSILISGVTTFGSIFAQHNFHLSPGIADIVIGGACVPFSIIGTLCGGFVMKRYGFGIRRSLIFCVLCSAGGFVFLGTLMPLGCEEQKIAGVNYNYPHETTPNLTAACNVNCACAPSHVMPICGSDYVTYISPCYAGCAAGIDLQRYYKELVHNPKVYYNCSCVSDEQQTAQSGLCISTYCKRMSAAFVVLTCGAVFLLCLCQAPVYTVLLRVVESRDKSLSLGIMSFLALAIGLVPSPIWFGRIVDTSCVYWGHACNNKSSCHLYDGYGLRLGFVGACMACAFLYTAIFAVSLLYMETHKERYEDAIVASDR